MIRLKMALTGEPKRNKVGLLMKRLLPLMAFKTWKAFSKA